MDRLQAELHRLYLPPQAGDGDIRALVLEIARPADWEALSLVWRGVQTDLQLPAPAIAVSGTDGLQLWFSLQQPVEPARAAAFLKALQAHYLPSIAPSRMRTQPAAGDKPWLAPAVPALQADGENWSAFVAPDLAPVFADTPWLDLPPSPDGQADLLARLAPIGMETFNAALQALGATPVSLAPALQNPTVACVPATDLDPRQFLQRVLNDEAASLELRVDAAKALLQFR